MRSVSIHHEPPSHGWLPLRLTVGDQTIQVEVSDVPNNPIQELIEALDCAASGTEARVWWHLEPDGYFLRFKPVDQEVLLALEFAPHSERSDASAVLSFQGAPEAVLLPFWRFVREFQSHAYAEPHWPSVNYDRLLAIKQRIGGTGEA